MFSGYLPSFRVKFYEYRTILHMQLEICHRMSSETLHSKIFNNIKYNKKLPFEHKENLLQIPLCSSNENNLPVDTGNKL